MVVDGHAAWRGLGASALRSTIDGAAGGGDKLVDGSGGMGESEQRSQSNERGRVEVRDREQRTEALQLALNLFFDQQFCRMKVRVEKHTDIDIHQIDKITSTKYIYII